MCGFANANLQNSNRHSQLDITTAIGGGFLLRTKTNRLNSLRRDLLAFRLDGDIPFSSARHCRKKLTNLTLAHERGICQQLKTRSEIIVKLAGKGKVDTADYEGKIYGSCSTACKDEFLKKPAAYFASK